PKARIPAALGVPQVPIVVGSRFTIAGIGVTISGEGSSGGTIRLAGLVATGQPGTLQIRLVDPVAKGIRDGLGACTGDSGGPVFEDGPAGAAIIGVISWSTGPNGSAGCGGLTGVTPLTLYRDWILQTARAWGSALWVFQVAPVKFAIPQASSLRTQGPITIDISDEASRPQFAQNDKPRRMGLRVRGDDNLKMIGLP